MNFPPFVKSMDYTFYNEELNQTLIAGLSDNGWTYPSVTIAQLNTPSVTNQQGTLVALKELMPTGTVWYVRDYGGGVWVGKKEDGSIVQFSTTSWP